MMLPFTFTHEAILVHTAAQKNNVKKGEPNSFETDFLQIGQTMTYFVVWVFS